MIYDVFKLRCGVPVSYKGIKCDNCDALYPQKSSKLKLGLGLKDLRLRFKVNQVTPSSAGYLNFNLICATFETDFKLGRECAMKSRYVCRTKHPDSDSEMIVTTGLGCSAKVHRLAGGPVCCFKPPPSVSRHMKWPARTDCPCKSFTSSHRMQILGESAGWQRHGIEIHLEIRVTEVV